MSDAPRSPTRSDVVLILTLADKEVRGDTLADALRDEFNAAADRSGASKIVVDFREVTFLASVGFRPLLALHQRVKAAGGRVVLCHLSLDVAETMRVTRFIDTAGSRAAPFEVQPDVPAAVTSLLRGP